MNGNTERENKGAHMKFGQIRQVKIYYLLVAIRFLGLSFIFATQTNYLLSMGLEQFGANMLNAIFFLALFLFEVPTGIFADTYGRKASVVTAFAFHTIGGAVYAVAGSFAGFAIAEILFAIGFTFVSGALDAWLIDGLKEQGVDKVPAKIFAKAQTFGQITTIVGAIIGSYLYVLKPNLPWLVSTVVYMLSGITAFMIMQEPVVKQAQHKGLNAMRETARVSFQFAKEHRIYRYILLLGSIQFFFMVPANMFWQPWFTRALGTSNLGYLWAAMMLSLALGGYAARHSKIEVRAEGLVLMLAQALVGVGIVLWALPGMIAITIIPFLLHEVGRGLYWPVKAAYLNHHLPNRERATLLSFDSQVNHLAGFAGLVLSGLLVGPIGYGLTLGLFGAGMVAASITIYKVYKP